MLRIKRLRIENFRKFRKPVELTGFGQGLNLICEPNEVGKSTILEAMRAVLFERHNAKAEKVKSFRPQGDEVAPVLQLEFVIAAQDWIVEKRFLDKPSVALTDGANRYQSEEAEEKLQSLLGFTRAGNRGADDESRGALGLLWVEQGQSFALTPPNQLARRTFETILEGEVGIVTGGKRAATVTKAVDASYADYFTPTGRPARQILDAEAALTDARQRLTTATQEFAAFEDVLVALDSKRGELRRVVREISDPDRIDANARIKADIDQATVAKKEVGRLEAAMKSTTAVREVAEARVKQRQADREALSKARDELAAKETEAGENIDRLAFLRDAETKASQDLSQWRLVVAETEVALQRARGALNMGREGVVLLAAFDRLDGALQLAKELRDVEQAIADARMDPTTLSTLDGLEREAVRARAVAAAGATTLEITLRSKSTTLKLDGRTLDGDYKGHVEGSQTIDIPGVGLIVITPPASGVTATSKLRAAEQDLTDFLAGVRYATAEDAREAARLRQDNVQLAKTLAASLVAKCPADPDLKIEAGLAQLRAALAGVDRGNTTGGDIHALDEACNHADQRFQEARQGAAQAEQLRGAALETMQAAELANAGLQAAYQQARAEVERQQLHLSQSEELASDDVLAGNLEAARIEDARALVALTEARQTNSDLDLEALTRRLEAAERRSRQLNEDRISLSSDIAGLEVQARLLGGAGPTARLEAAQGEVEVLAETLGRIRREASVIELLRNVLAETRSDTSRRFLAPVAKRVEPYLQRVLPNAALAFADDFKPTELIRSGRQESSEYLSKGTQEQLAILTRLAFADLLLDKGMPASLVLDDALVFSDDDRFETMTDILSEVAKRMQIIVLSCRASAYRHVEANRIKIER